MSRARSCRFNSGMEERIIARVTEDKNQQRRVTIPKKNLTIKEGDWVEIRRIEFQ